MISVVNVLKAFYHANYIVCISNSAVLADIPFEDLDFDNIDCFSIYHEDNSLVCMVDFDNQTRKVTYIDFF